ncbi:NrdH-redoxin [Vibrio sp. 10N.286.49.B3]|uniref:glutaredoxin family protein n=1 Tax=Vibrio sp. 10N.286.49.B3 TaxID=1880855 RepID=UPI000C837607|nr:glutaredoxin family protein [Vibrio sp. 10N.286.49.B3]PMH46502.1 NrdH-redoxin [Vibrio sp. 10N.286.49.B3]
MLILYSTKGCHLCEMALSLLQQLNLDEHVTLIDIAFDDELFSRYGVTIPVLQYQDSDLNWPFGPHELQDWLTKHGITYHT